jgi:hypothetical protein
VLPGPFGWQVGEASYAHAVRESAINGSFDEIGCEEGKRDCHVYFADAALAIQPPTFETTVAVHITAKIA